MFGGQSVTVQVHLGKQGQALGLGLVPTFPLWALTPHAFPGAGTSPWHRSRAWGWSLGSVRPLRSLLLHGKGCLGEPACCLWDPAGPRAPSNPAAFGKAGKRSVLPAKVVPGCE